MSECAAQTFSGVTQDQFAYLRAKAEAQGISIEGNSGSASKDGMTISWEFSPEAGTLTIQCTASPFYVTCGTINAKLHELVDSCS
jgi:hypothetical protein